MLLRGAIGTACVLCEEIVALLAYLIRWWLLLLGLIGAAWLLLIICGVGVEGHVLEAGLNRRCDHFILGHASATHHAPLRASSWQKVRWDLHLTHVIQAHHRFKPGRWRLIDTVIGGGNLWIWVQGRCHSRVILF